MAEIKELDIKQPDQEVIQRLEEILEMAKSGYVQSVVIVTSNNDQSTDACWAGMNKNNMAVIGALRAMEHDLLDAFVYLRRDYV